MSLRCKPGDLAYITRQPYLGRLVNVLHLAPVGSHRLPDGYPALTDKPNCWVIESLGSPFNAPIAITKSVRGTRTAQFGVCPDRHLRPIRGEESFDDLRIEEELTA